MYDNPLGKSALTEHFNGLSLMTRATVHTRAREMALRAGDASPHVSQADYEQAKQELAGLVVVDRQESAHGSIPDPDRRGTAPAASGFRVADTSCEEESAGRGATGRLVAKGAAKAEDDRVPQSAPTGDRQP